MADELAKAAKKVKTLPQQMVRAGTKQIQSPLLAAYRRDSGGDLKLSGVPGAWRFKTPASVRGRQLVRGRVRVTPAGPASWLNEGTRRRGNHPGTPAKHTFNDAITPALVDAQREMERIFGRAFN